MTPAESALIANRVCKTLEALLRDRGFKDDVYKLAELSRKQSDFHQQLAEACRAVETLAKEQDDERSSQQRWKRIRRWGLGLGGLSLVAADAVAAVPSSGIATASFTLGGAAVTAALA